MSDTQRRKVLHYGSLEEQEKKRLESGQSSGSLAGDAIKSGITAGNINLASSDTQDVLETVSSTTAEILAEFERRKKVLTK